MANQLLEEGHGPVKAKDWWVGVKVRCWACGSLFRVGANEDATEVGSPRPPDFNAQAETECPKCHSPISISRADAAVHRQSTHVPVPGYVARRAGG